MMSDELERRPLDHTATAPSVPAPLTTAASITTFGTLAWLAWLWGLAALANVLALAAITIWGSMTQSLWVNAFAGWQRWPIAGAGFTMVAMFLPLLVTHGSTRRRLAQSSVITAAVLAIGAAIVITVGFALEGVLYRSQDWVHAVSEGGHTIGGIGHLTLLGTYAVTLAAYFVGGWIVAAGLHRLGWWGLVPGIVAGLALVMAVEYLVAIDAAVSQFAFLHDLDGPPLAVGAPLALALIALAVVATARVTRGIEVD